MGLFTVNESTKSRIRSRVVFLKSLFLLSLSLSFCANAALVSAGPSENYLEKLIRLAESGQSIRSYRLGFIYRDGSTAYGVSKNGTEAVKWFAKAGYQGWPMAFYRIAVMYQEGDGVPQDNTMAEKWHRVAANDGFSWSQYELGIMYRDGVVVNKDDVLAVEWLLKAAEQGYVRAQAEIGLNYYHGRGIVENFTAAADWWLKAAQEGHLEAKSFISFMYRYGQGIEKNLIKSYAWGLLSLSGGITPQGWETLRPLMTTIDINNAQALASSLKEKENWKIKTFQVDGLQITKKERKDSYSECSQGHIYKFNLHGKISRDSTFIMEDVFEGIAPCKKENGDIIPIKVTLNSNGGTLEDGYKLGALFRKTNVSTVVESGDVCGSSCAIAFIGGKERDLQDNGVLVLHAPYTVQIKESGKKQYTCIDGKNELKALQDYLTRMTTAQNGKRLFNRTMMYCNPDDGWTITGKDTAKLYGL
jgi:ATP-dependent protease ClpP protease subunit